MLGACLQDLCRTYMCSQTPLRLHLPTETYHQTPGSMCVCIGLAKQSTHTNTWLSSESPPRTNQLNTHRNQTPDFTPALAPRAVQGGADAELWLSLSPLASEPDGQFQIVHPELSISLLIVSVNIDLDTTIASTLLTLCTWLGITVGSGISNH